MNKTNKYLIELSIQAAQLETLTSESEVSKPEVSKWSVGQHVEHLLKADTLATSAMLASKRYTSRRTPLKLLGRIVLLTGYIPKGRGKAPEMTLPEQPTKENITRLVEAFKNNLSQIKEGLRELNLAGHYAPHPIFGDLDQVQWLRFLIIHNKHHLKIINEILAK